MSSDRMARRAAVILFALATLILGHPGAARADVETCGAHLRPLVGLVQQPNANAATYAYVLRADTGRSVQGQIVADTDHGWFEWAFPLTVLTQRPVSVHVRGIEMTGKDYESDPLYVAFPSGTIVKRAWVEQARTTGETFFGWDARGSASCSLPDFGDSDPRGVPDVPSSLPNGASVATAMTTDALLVADCAQPFAAATVVSVPRIEQSDVSGPTYGIGVFAVTIDNTGAVVDAWTFGSTGNPRWDTAASAALRQAKFKPPLSYCRPVAATIFVVESFRQ
jgi:hypothetical protein